MTMSIVRRNIMRIYRISILLTLLALIVLSSCSPAGGLTLNGTSWELESMAGMPLIEGRSITLNFEAAEIDGNAGCNHYFGGYTINSVGGLQFGMIGMTEMACLDPDGIMQQESAYLSYLGTVVKAVREGNQLKLQDAAGDDVLVYSAVSG
jgi:heat shock protein HslJ